MRSPLVVLGALVNAWLGAGADLAQLRLPGVLQRIGLVGLVGAIVVVALVLWIGLFVLGRALEVTRHGDRSVAQAFLDTHGSVAYLAAFGGLWVVVACAMHAARWYVRL